MMNDWMRLDVPVPPQLEEAMGYAGEARWVRFYWHPCGDEAEFDDGQLSGTGDWMGFLAFVGHAQVAPKLAGYDLGSSDGEARHCLLLDRSERALYVAPMRSAGRFLVAQHEPFHLGPVSGEDEIVAGPSVPDLLDLSAWKEVEIDEAALRQSMERRRQLLKEMTLFLNDN